MCLRCQRRNGKGTERGATEINSQAIVNRTRKVGEKCVAEAKRRKKPAILILFFFSHFHVRYLFMRVFILALLGGDGRVHARDGDNVCALMHRRHILKAP